MSETRNYDDVFTQIVPGMIPAQVEAILGKPQKIFDGRVPAGSAWGLQDGLRYKIKAGAPVLQWCYLDEEHDHAVFFARRWGQWRVTARLSNLAGLLCERVMDRSAFES